MREGEVANITLSYEEQEVAESHNDPRPEEGAQKVATVDQTKSFETFQYERLHIFAV